MESTGSLFLNNSNRITKEKWCLRLHCSQGSNCQSSEPFTFPVLKISTLPYSKSLYFFFFQGKIRNGIACTLYKDGASRNSQLWKSWAESGEAMAVELLSISTSGKEEGATSFTPVHGSFGSNQYLQMNPKSTASSNFCVFVWL